MTPLESDVDSAAYEALVKHNPMLVAAIREAMGAGASPTEIEYRVARKYGAGQMSRNVRHAAEYMRRTNGA